MEECMSIESGNYGVTSSHEGKTMLWFPNWKND